jgi:hypothetical protein
MACGKHVYEERGKREGERERGREVDETTKEINRK